MSEIKKNGFTGYNPSRAKYNINNFADCSMRIISYLEEVNYNFFNNLRKYWASPRALDFYSNFGPKIMESVDIMTSNINSIITGASRAYNYAAGSHGGGYIDASSFIKKGRQIELPLLFESINGIVGMNISVVNEKLLPEYRSSISKVISEFDSLPKSIALYDDENGQQHAYSTHIKELANAIADFYQQIVNEIEYNINTETNNILLAKQEATELLNG